MRYFLISKNVKNSDWRPLENIALIQLGRAKVKRCPHGKITFIQWWWWGGGGMDSLMNTNPTMTFKKWLDYSYYLFTYIIKKDHEWTHSLLNNWTAIRFPSEYPNKQRYEEQFLFQWTLQGGALHKSGLSHGKSLWGQDSSRKGI